MPAWDSLFLSSQDGDQFVHFFPAIACISRFEGVLHTGIDVVVDNDCLQAAERRACGLNLPHHIDTIAVFRDHFPYRSNLALYACQARVGFTLCFVPHLRFLDW